jgi:hypothetical protein
VAVVAGNAASGSPTGTVSFYECGPTATAQPCTSKSKPVGGAQNLSAGANNTSSVTSPPFTANSTGYWCFAGYYSGDSPTYVASVDRSTDECFYVSSATTSNSSAPSSPVTQILFPNTDVDTVTGNSAGGSPTGTVTYYVCGPTQKPIACHSTAKEVGTPAPLVAGASNTSHATSAAFVPTSGGYWCFASDYSGDSNYNASSDSSVNECFDVPPFITSANGVTFTEGETASPFQVTFIGGYGSVQYSETGALPSGVTLTPAGVLSGTPPPLLTGTYPITISATDASGNTGTQSFTLTVASTGQFYVATLSLPGATPGSFYQADLNAAGGPGPYKWKLASGKLPKGVKLNKETGVLSGVVNAKVKAGTSTVTVQATDSAHPKQSATRSLTITVS